METTEIRDEHAEWLAFRRTGLGGTDVAAIFGEVPSRTAIDVWQDKVGESEDWAGNERTRWGLILEPIVAREYAVEQGVITIAPDPKTYRHPDRAWQLGSPDRLVYQSGRIMARPFAGDLDPELVPDNLPEPDYGLEIKTHGYHGAMMYGEAGTDEVPGDKRIQCAWYESLLELNRWDLAALYDTHLLRCYTIMRDQELEDYLLEEAERFWTCHVERRVAPDPDGSDSFKRYLAQKFAMHTDVVLDRTPEVDELAVRLREAKVMEKRIGLERSRIEQEIQKVIGDDMGVAVEGGRIMWKETRSGKYAEKDLRAELYERLDLTPDEIKDIEARHERPNYRRIYTPQKWTRGVK